ncbi:unnamed protein product [Clonostachys rosea]|uniref:Uncharacterized protein n=1 Tax=Bionectria ochroleuca TaxID=29856 RepID=A0ABY6UCU7_BIOOC|nr:unnamed protein product [Clonostachys rosea]
MELEAKITADTNECHHPVQHENDPSSIEFAIEESTSGEKRGHKDLTPDPFNDSDAEHRKQKIEELEEVDVNGEDAGDKDLHRAPRIQDSFYASEQERLEHEMRDPGDTEPLGTEDEIGATREERDNLKELLRRLDIIEGKSEKLQAELKNLEDPAQHHRDLEAEVKKLEEKIQKVREEFQSWERAAICFTERSRYSQES